MSITNADKKSFQKWKNFYEESLTIIKSLKENENCDSNFMTFKCLKENVPAEVPGIAFLSGGQSSDLATAHLCKMNEKYSDQMPWNLTFSYGRALQHDALNAWGGSDRVAGQKALMERAEGNSLATYGKELTLQ